MYSKFRQSKSLVLLTSLTIIASMSAVSTWAAGPSNDAIGSSVAEQTTERRIILDNPDVQYTFIGTNSECNIAESENVKTVNKDDNIFIKAPGEYNITIKDVNHVDKNLIECSSEAAKDITINLTLEGNNNLKDLTVRSWDGWAVGDINITKKSIGSLNCDRIIAKNVTIKGGEINTKSRNAGILVHDRYVRIEGGKVNIGADIDAYCVVITGGQTNIKTSSESAITNGTRSFFKKESQFTIKGGTLAIDASKGQGIGYFDDINIEGGTTTIKVGGTERAISGKNIKVTGGNVTATNSGEDRNSTIECKSIVVQGGNITAVNEDNNVCYGAIKTDSMIVEGGNITAISKSKEGDDKFGIFVEGDMTVKGGNIKSTFPEGEKGIGIEVCGDFNVDKLGEGKINGKDAMLIYTIVNLSTPSKSK